MSFSHRRNLRARIFQTASFLCAVLACANAVVLSGYDGHGLSAYSDYGDLADGYIESTGYKVLPTVAVPVHSVSAAPLHLDASLDHHGYKHVEQDHDYYVSASFTNMLIRERACSENVTRFVRESLKISSKNSSKFSKISRRFSFLFLGKCNF